MSILSNWFQTGPIPVDAMGGEYDSMLVVLSYVIAVLASYVALNLVGRLRAEKNKRVSMYWLAGGAFAMGAGIWSMHFIGMLAFIMSMPMQYEFVWTSASLFMAIIASGFALYILQKQSYSTLQLVAGGVILGIAISSMHYMGMQGMKMQMAIHYLPGLFFLSIGIGIAASEAALYLALQSNRGSGRRQFYLKIFSALVMGVAICGMHYTGMAAAVFTMLPSHMMKTHELIPANYLAFIIAGTAALIIILALIASNNKRMVVAVENEKDFLRAMLDNLEDGIIACDATGKITVINHVLQKNLLVSHPVSHMDDLINYCSLMTKDNNVLTNNEMPLQRVMKDQTVRGMELKLRFNNNVVRDVVVDGQKILNAEGKNLGAVVAIHDVTELKRTEKLKSEFVSIVSHELRTPLTSIRGSLGLLVSGVMNDYPEKTRQLIEIANNNCERLLVLINDILDIEKIEAGKMEFKLETVDINDVIDESIATNKMYADRFGVNLEIVKPEAELLVHVDSSRLMQVLANLISNACKFSPKGETVYITIKKIKDGVRVSVIDKGPGIPKEFQPRIFQKFTQADSSDTRGKGGTGLGLNISKTIIEKLGGTINFMSKSKQDTTFYFDLPLSPQAHTSAQPDSAPENKRRLLICEDDQDQSTYLKVLLESVGFTVDVANTVNQAKKLISEKIYQALLLDLILPDQDGIAFIRELRSEERSKDLQIIVISIIAKTGQALLSGDAVSVADWLDKPVDFNKLLLSVNRIRKNGDTRPHILHVEDNVDTQHVVGTLLEQYAVVSTANSLEQAREMLNKNGGYDLIILDLLLPDGNGMDILPLLAQTKSPVLVFSDMKLNDEYSKYVSQTLVKSTSSNEKLLNTIVHLL